MSCSRATTNASSWLRPISTSRPGRHTSTPGAGAYRAGASQAFNSAFESIANLLDVAREYSRTRGDSRGAAALRLLVVALAAAFGTRHPGPAGADTAPAWTERLARDRK